MHEIAFVGRSNVGKSSLLRKLFGIRARVGKRPGVTRRIVRYELCDKLAVVDMPGFGYMEGISKSEVERIKDLIIRYLERNAGERIVLGVLVVDASSFLEIAERWWKRDQIPVEVEFFSFLRELGLNPVVAANKIDKLGKIERDRVLDEMCDWLGLKPPWSNWMDVIIPTSAKTGEGVDNLRKTIKKRLIWIGREDLAACIS